MKTSNGFTLIELLIIIAMISIFSSITIGMIVMPMREQARLEIEASMRQGLDLATALLYEDIYEAKEVQVIPETNALRIVPTHQDRKTLVYTASEGTLYRRLEGNDGEGALLLNHVTTWDITLLDDGMLAVEIEAETERAGAVLHVDRSIQIDTQQRWLKETR